MSAQPYPIPPPPPLPASYLQDKQWIQEHMNELVQSYPDMWIGVVNGCVIAASRSQGDVRKQVEAACPGSTPYVCLSERHPRVYAG